MSFLVGQHFDTYQVRVDVDEKTARRVAEMLRLGESEFALTSVVEDALNLHAMPRLISGALRCPLSQPNGKG